MTRVAEAEGISRFFLLQKSRIGQKDVQQVASTRRAKHRTAKAALAQPRQVAAMIQVCVREHHRAQRGWFEAWLLPVALTQLLVTLEEATVDQHALALVFEQIA